MAKFYEGLAEALSLYVRALAWWHAVPELPAASKARPRPTLRSEALSRMAVCLNAGDEPYLPDLDQALGHFVAMLFDAGPVSATGMGPIPLTWADLEAWQRGAGVPLPPWQARLIRRLSADYLAALREAEKHDAIAPWRQVTTAEQRAKVAARVKNVLRG